MYPRPAPACSQRFGKRIGRRHPLLALAALATTVALAAGCGSAAKHPRHAASTPPQHSKPAVVPIDWPIYGLTPDHHRYLDADVHPPFHPRWTFNSNGLLEFPPAISDNAIYQLNDNAVLNALDRDTGRQLWYRQLGSLSASTPAVGGGAVYATVLDRGNGDGRVVALGASDGHVIWQRDLPSASESSPLLANGMLYFGTQGGTVYALNAADGSVKWTYAAAGSVKGSPALSNGILYFGDYGDQVHAVSARTGNSIWTGHGSDSLYATAAVGFGRVYIGDTSGNVYAFDARTGSQVWSQGTGSDVYAGAAVLDTPGLGPTVYLGSYDGNFYAFDAATGNVRWKFNAGGRISGSESIVGKIVYFADLGDHITYGLDVRTGKVVYKFPHGAFDPVVSDGIRLYLDGIDSIVALDPDQPPARPATPPSG
jgi:outer membrane protein assembly factor BamB